LTLEKLPTMWRSGIISRGRVAQRSTVSLRTHYTLWRV